MTNIPVGTCTISRNDLKRHYLKNKRLFLDFLLHFWNVHETYKILKKNDENRSPIFAKIIDSERGGYLNIWKVLLLNTIK